MRILLAILLLASAALAQGGNTVTITGAGAPAGTCAFVMRYINSSNGDFYACFNGSWNLIGPSSGGTPGGANTNVQYNNAGAFAGSNNFIWTNASSKLTVTGDIYTTRIAVGTGVVPLPTDAATVGYWGADYISTDAAIGKTVAPGVDSGLGYVGLNIGLNCAASVAVPTSGCFGNAVVATTPSGNARAWAGVYAGQFIALHAGSGALTNLYGFDAEAYNDGGATVANLGGAFINAAPSAGTVTNLYGANINASTTGATVTNAYGLKISDISGAGTLNYSIFTGAGSVRLGGLTSNGLVQTSGGTGDLSILVPGTGVATFLATPSSGNFLSAITDEVGNGSKVVKTDTVSGTGTALVTTTGAQTSGRCVEIDANGNHIASGAGCGGAGSAFNDITSGTNTTAAMVVGTGGSLGVSGSGTIAATTATALAANPSDCGANTFADAIAANGDLTCNPVVEADITLADNTTNNVSTSKHGFAPKGDGDTTKFLNANGAYSTPAGGSTYYSFYPCSQSSGGSQPQGSILTPSGATGAQCVIVGTAPYTLPVMLFNSGAGQFGQVHMGIPDSWGATINVQLGYYTSATTAGDLTWEIKSFCSSAGTVMTGAPTFNAANTITQANNTSTTEAAQFPTISVTTTGCSSGNTLFIQIKRTDAVAVSARLFNVRVKL